MSNAVWNPTQAVIDLQPNGPGNDWVIFGINGQTIQVSATAPSGGGRSVASRYARNVHSGQLETIATVSDGDPERVTFDIKRRLTNSDWKEVLKRLNCAHSVRFRNGCGNYTDLSSFTNALLYADSYAVGYSLDGDPVNAIGDQAADVMRVINESASDELMLRNVNHLDISGTVTDFAINKVRSIGFFRCGGECGTFTDGTESYIAIGDQDSTPGYLGAANPKWYITESGGASWYSGQIDVFGNAPGLDILKVGKYVIAVANGAGGGLAYALYDDLVNGVSPAWTLAPSVTNSLGSPKALAVADGQTVYAAGTNGYIYKSTDGGLTYSVLSAGGQTAQTINSAAFADAYLGFFGANSTVLIKYDNGALSVVTLPAGVTGNINVVAIPDPVRRGHEIYIGTSTGQIWRSRRSGATGSWEQLGFADSGSGAITDIQFSPGNGSQLMYVIQTRSNNTSRVLRDLSGGYMGKNIQVLGGYTDPANFTINSIGVSGINDALSVGEVHLTWAFLGKIS